VSAVSKLQWLLDEQQCPEPDDLACSAVHAPTLGMLKYLKQRGYVFTAETCVAAATTLQAASVLQYLHSEGAQFDVRTLTNAMPVQELPLLQWLCERGCNLSEVNPFAARAMGDVKVLSWLHSKGCRATTTSCLRWPPATVASTHCSGSKTIVS
jgi:hypothetical protein